jgi:hypothetical protein
MRSKSIIALITTLALSATLFASGCRRDDRHRARAQRAQESAPTENIAPSDVKTTTKTDQTANAASNQTETNSIVDPGNAEVDLPEREELRRSYKLSPGAQVIVGNISGRIDVETADIDHAEVLIVRSAKGRDDLQFRRINIEHEPDRLNIRVENDRKSLFSALGKVPEGRQRVILKLPRKIEFNAHGANGEITIGEIDGAVELNGINGDIKVARANGVELRAVNGNLDVTVAKLNPRGVEASGINGNLDLRFAETVNADVNIHNINGQINPELPNFVANGEQRHGRLEGRAGSGGAHIEVRGVNGNVNLIKAEKATATTAKTSTN